MRQQKLKLSTIIKRVVAITALLALVEVAVIYFYMNGRNSKKALVSKKEMKQTPATLSKDTIPTTLAITQTEAPKQEQQILIETQIPEQQVASVPQKIEQQVVIETQNKKPQVAIKAIPSQVVSPSKAGVKTKKIDSIKTNSPTAPQVKKYIERQLSGEEMTQLLMDINAAKAKLNNQTKCIQIRKTQTSNIDNGFEIATFLKQKGYVISGREVVNASIKGILIDAGASCIKLTIGNL